MSDVKWLQTDDYLVIIFPGEAPKTLETSSPDFKLVKRALTSKAFKKAREMLSPEKALLGKKKGLGVTEEGALSVDGEVQDPVILTILKRFKEGGHGVNHKALVALGRKINKIGNAHIKSQLSEFLRRNKVPITPDGCFLTYKGVKKDDDGNLVDLHTGTFRNNVGDTVQMDRSLVQQDPTVTCAPGLHVAAYGYVRECYGGSEFIICKVDPLDVVSVPTDYDAQKMRTCRYRVIGKLSDKVEIEDSYVPWVQDIAPAIVKAKEPEPKVVVEEPVTAATKIEEAVAYAKETVEQAQKTMSLDLDSLSGAQIVQATLLHTHEFISISVKSKQRVIKKAVEAFLRASLDAEFDGKTLQFTPRGVDLENMSGPQIISYVKSVTGTDITISPKSKQRVLAQARKLLAAHVV